MSALPTKHEFFRHSVAKQGDALAAAGIGLEGIGLMLVERNLSEEEMNALNHAVIGLGAMVRDAGYRMYSEATELESSQ